MRLKRTPGFLKNPGVDSGLALGQGWGGGGGMMTTVLRKHTKQYHHKSRFTRYLQYFRDVGTISYSHQLYSGLCELDIGLCEGFRRKLENWLGGSLFFTRYLKYLGHVVVHCCPPFLSSIDAFGGGGGGGGMMTYRQLLEHHAPLQRQTLLR